MPGQILAEALAAWREAERALEQTPPGTKDHETVRLIVVRMRAIYADLAQAKTMSKARLDRSREAIVLAREALKEHRAG